MVSLQQHHRRLARSATLIILLLLGQSGAWAALCANPGRDGQGGGDAVINSYFTGPDTQTLSPGTRTFSLTRQRGAAPLRAGDLALLLQVQGASINTANRTGYGQLQGHGLVAEWVRIDRLEGQQVWIQGGGPGGGLLHSYVNAPASREQGRRRWQLVRVPQYEHFSLQQDSRALPWDGHTGGVLAVDVRRKVTLNGHRLSVAGTGFRGGPALSLQGALGRPADWRYPAPSVQDRQAGYGHHASKGEGVAGTPALLLEAGKGYPDGDMGRGAPANAGGGGNGLDLSHQRLGNGGGGGNGAAGGHGLPAEGGGRGGHEAPRALVLGGGGGAAARRKGDGGQGAAGGGLLLIRAAGLQGQGALDLRGAAGSAAGDVGGGGGSGGTLWLDLPVTDSLAVTPEHAGGAGAKGGGQGGDGQLLSRGERQWSGFQSLTVAGAEAGFRCRPAGHWVTGVLFEDNGASDGQAFNQRRDGDEAPLPGLTLTLQDPASDWQKTTTSAASGAFQFRLSEAQSRGQALWLSLSVPEGWSLPVLPALNGKPGQRHGNQLRWQLTASADRHSGPLPVGLIAEPVWQAPADTALAPGSTAVLAFEYQAPVTGQVQFHSAHPAVRGLLMDRACSGDSEQWQSGQNAGWPVTAGERLCVRVPVRFDGQPARIPVTATTLPDNAPTGFMITPQQTSVKILPGS